MKFIKGTCFGTRNKCLKTRIEDENNQIKYKHNITKLGYTTIRDNRIMISLNHLKK